jgi:hypothetical protein
MTDPTISVYVGDDFITVPADARVSELIEIAERTQAVAAGLVVLVRRGAVLSEHATVGDVCSAADRLRLIAVDDLLDAELQFDAHVGEVLGRFLDAVHYEAGGGTEPIPFDEFSAAYERVRENDPDLTERAVLLSRPYTPSRNPRQE